MPNTGLKPSINKYVFNKWISEYDNAIFNLLHDINPNLELLPYIMRCITRLKLCPFKSIVFEMKFQKFN